MIWLSSLGHSLKWPLSTRYISLLALWCFSSGPFDASAQTLTSPEADERLESGQESDQESNQESNQESSQASPGLLQQLLNPTPIPPELNTGRLSDTLLSVFPGILIHGIGHWHRGDRVSAQRALLLEALGISAILSGYTLETMIDRRHQSLYLTERWLYHSGGALLLASWLTDVVGSFRGDVSRRSLGRALEPKHISIGYRYRDDLQRIHNHHWVAELQYQIARVRVNGRINWEFEGEVIGAEGSIMGSVYRADKAASHFLSQLEVGVRVRRWAWVSEELTQWVITPQIEETIGLDLLSPGLKGFALFHRIGVGMERFELTSLIKNRESISKLTDYPLMMESGLKIQPYRSISLKVSVLEDNTLDLRPLTRSGLFLGGQVLLKQSEQLAVTVNAIRGDEWSMWAMLTFTLGARR